MNGLQLIRSVCFGAVLASTAGSAGAQASYFPSRAFDDVGRNSDFKAEGYTAELKLLGETSYVVAAKSPLTHCYRFTWLRTFKQPIAVAMDIREDGTALLTVKIGNGEAGYPRTTTALVRNTSRTLTVAEVKAFLARVDKVHFWTAPNHIQGDQTGTDGSEWIIEGVRAGKYHVVGRWSPGPNQPGKAVARELGLALAIDLAQLKIPAKELY